MATGRGAIVTSRPLAGRIGRVRGRSVMLAAAGMVALVLALVLGVGLGTVAIAPGETFAILAHRLFGLDLGVTWTPAIEAIRAPLWAGELPRAADVVYTCVAAAAALALGAWVFNRADDRIAVEL